MKTRYVDKVGNSIHEGDIILSYTNYNGLKIYKVLGETEHNLKVSAGGKSTYIPCNRDSVLNLTFMVDPRDIYEKINKL